jgi:hypothetical protein
MSKIVKRDNCVRKFAVSAQLLMLKNLLIALMQYWKKVFKTGDKPGDK